MLMAAFNGSYVTFLNWQVTYCHACTKAQQLHMGMYENTSTNINFLTLRWYGWNNC